MFSFSTSCCFVEDSTTLVILQIMRSIHFDVNKHFWISYFIRTEFWVFILCITQYNFGFKAVFYDIFKYWQTKINITHTMQYCWEVILKTVHAKSGSYRKQLCPFSPFTILKIMRSIHFDVNKHFQIPYIRRTEF